MIFKLPKYDLDPRAYRRQQIGVDSRVISRKLLRRDGTPVGFSVSQRRLWINFNTGMGLNPPTIKYNVGVWNLADLSAEYLEAVRMVAVVLDLPKDSVRTLESALEELILGYGHMFDH